MRSGERSRSGLRIAAAFVALLWTCGASPGVALLEAVDRERLGPGVDLIIYEADDNALLDVVRFGPSGARIRVKSGGPATAQEFQRRTGALAVVTYEPSDAAPASQFCVRGDRFHISAPSPAAQGEDCVLGGPMILRDGAPAAQAEGAAVREGRAFACSTQSGALLLGVAEAMDRGQLAQLLLDPELGCADAMELSRGVAAALATAKDVFGETRARAPGAVAVLPR